MPAIVNVLQPFLQYVQRTVIGTARGIYKKYGKIETQERFINTMHACVCMYLNQCYCSLLTNDDDIVTTDCAPFTRHSPRCLFVIKREFIFRLLKEVNFNLLDWTTLESFHLSLELQWKQLTQIHEQYMDTIFFHKCAGPSKENCVVEDLFVVTKDEEKTKDQTIQWFCFYPNCSLQAKYRCGRCRGAHYCSKKHQKEHWNIHKLEGCKNQVIH